MFCYNNHTAAHVITFSRIYVTSLTKTVTAMRFLIEIMFILNAVFSHFNGSYNKQNLTTVVISYEIYETHRRFVS